MNKYLTFLTDANKNVTELTDESGAVVAHYEYSPFGTVTHATDPFAADNPFRFSSEYSDAETGLVYYNYRYYSPELGRWISRDPIEEQGGYNLYGMLGNNPMLGWDVLGYGHKWWCPMGAYSWVMTGDRNASTEMISASEHGFAEGLSEESYIDYWSEIFYQNDLSITFGGYADYAFCSGAGISVEGEFSVLNGWGLNINFDANLGYGASAGGYVGASIAAPSISTPGDLSISSGFDIKGPVGGSVSLGGGRLGGSVSIGVGVFYGVTLTTPLY